MLMNIAGAGLGLGICVGFVLFVLFAYAVFYIFSLYNGLIELNNNMDKAWANIDVLLKKRSDLIPNLVETVKGYMKHEKEVLTKITELRSELSHETETKDKAKTSNQITETLKTIFAVAENYPQLKANENFLHLQKEMSLIEEQIADRREFFNNSVLLFNTRIQVIPDSLFASILGYKKKDYFKVEESERENVKINI
jgi:LemA protein